MLPCRQLVATVERRSHPRQKLSSPSQEDVASLDKGTETTKHPTSSFSPKISALLDCFEFNRLHHPSLEFFHIRLHLTRALQAVPVFILEYGVLTILEIRSGALVGDLIEFASSTLRAAVVCSLSCSEVKCTSNALCSGKPATVVITDDCPGGPCVSDAIHFDLSGTAFGAMAISSKAEQLRNTGMLQIQYKRVPCIYPGVNIVFHVDAGSNPYYFAVVVEYVNGDGELGAVDLLPSTAGAKWIAMQHLEGGGVWKLNYWSSPLQPPFSLRVTTPAGKILMAANVIPVGWQPGSAYKSLVNFKN